MKTLKKHAGHAFTGFELSKKTLNNLSQFNLKPIAKLVLLYLCDCYNPQHGEMFPKQSTIAVKLGVSEISIVRAIQELHKEGLIISERKYTNRYKFTSKIVSEEGIIEEKEMIVETYQNEKETIKMITHDHKQIKETNKTTNVDEFKILKEYAQRFGAKNIPAYINGLRKRGAVEKIIADYKELQASEKWHKKRTEETFKNIREVKAIETSSPEDCKKLQEFLKLYKKQA